MIYPINTETQTPRQNMINTVNKHYRGYTFKKTVVQHLEELQLACSEAKKRIQYAIDNAKTPEKKEHWLEAMNELNKVSIEPHDCNIDYKQYMASQLTLKKL